ncbi:MAG TPA: SDR family NAD(P)-dependent oxidoreductase [Thermodesulfobacteriota bacterium]|nr:SDR family NAD(P)-dependent oxidoreductase [Thermodesulfobacteriota bacterium]
MKPAIWKALEGAKLLKGKNAVITGAAAGIGKACALLFADQGAGVAVVDVREDEIENVCREIASQGGKCLAVKADVASSDAPGEILQAAVDAFGGLDVLVNNAGGGLPTDFFSITLEEWSRIVNLNLTATFALSQKAAGIFRERGGGVIVNISSQAGRSVSPTAGVHYTASKAGVIGLTRHMARVLAQHNIRVNAVCPGITNSERLMKRLSEKGTEEEMKKSVPLGRIGDVDEIAASCLFLASDLAGYITGASMDVNGGSLMI